MRVGVGDKSLSFDNIEIDVFHAAPHSSLRSIHPQATKLALAQGQMPVKCWSGQ